MNVASAFAFGIAGQGIFLSFLLFKNKKIISNYWIGLFIASFSLILAYWGIFWSDFPLLIRRFDFSVPITFLIGPCLFLAVKLKRDRSFLHFLPAATCLILFIPEWINLFSTGDYGFWSTSNFRYLYRGSMYLGILQNTIYAIYIMRSIRSQEFRLLALAVLLFNTTLVVYYVLSQLGLMANWIDYSTSFLMAVGFYYTGYYYMFQYGILKKSNANYESGDNLEIFIAMKIHLEESKNYLDPGYSLAQLSMEVKQPVRKITSAIKNSGFRNFNEFINSFRINYSKKKLIGSDDKILAVALESGFSNKVSFIQNFKKFTNKTPGEYRTFKLMPVLKTKPQLQLK